MRFTSNGIIEIGKDYVSIEDRAVINSIVEDYWPSDLYDIDTIVEEAVDKAPLSRIIQEIGDEAKLLVYMTDGAIEEEFYLRDLDEVTSHEQADKWTERIDEALPYLRDEQVDELLDKLLKEQHRRLVHEMKMKGEVV